MGRRVLIECCCYSLIALFGLAVVGCSAEDDYSANGKTSCGSPGTEEECTCDTGGTSIRVCQPWGWSPCVCDHDAGDAGGADAEIREGGTDGTGGTGGTEANNGGSGGSGGEAGAGPAGGSGGVGGSTDANPDGGAGDAGTDSGVADTGSGVPPYGQCTDVSECAGADATCYRAGANATVSASTPGFCTVACEPSNPNCPDPTDGTATATCSDTSSNCILDCGSGAVCPGGMVCDDFSVIQACNYPES
jgi:hypothetical protein